MKCNEIQVWLVGAALEETLPAPVRRHLECCHACRHRRELLGRLDESIRELAVPLAAVSKRESLLLRLPHLPYRGSASDSPRQGSRLSPGKISLILAAAATILMVLFWRPGSISPPRTGSDQTTPAPSPDLSLQAIVGVAEADVRLASASTGSEQLDAFRSMADTLQREALRLARHGPRSELPLVSRLYDQVIRRGVAGRLKTLPAQEQGRLVPEVSADLFRFERELDALSAECLPLVADLLRPIAQTARDGAASLRVASPPVPQTSDRFDKSDVPLLAVIVDNGLRLGEATDPMRRAQLTADLAESLAQVIVLCAMDSDSSQAGELGNSMGTLLDRGLAVHLAQAESADLGGTRREEIDHLRQGAVRASAVLERNLAKAPPAARKGLERALLASGPGRDKVTKGGKGKKNAGQTGPPWLREGSGKKKGSPHGKSFVPPGLDKK